MVVEIQGFIIGRNGYFWKEESNSIKHDILIFKITTISLSMNLSKLIDSHLSMKIQFFLWSTKRIGVYDSHEYYVMYNAKASVPDL